MSALDIAAIEARREVERGLRDTITCSHDEMRMIQNLCASSADIPELCAEVQHLRVVRENQAAVIRKQRKELDELRYRLEGAAK